MSNSRVPLYVAYRTKAATYRALGATTRGEKRAADRRRESALKRSEQGRGVLQRAAAAEQKRQETRAANKAGKPYNYLVVARSHTEENAYVTVVSSHRLSDDEVFARARTFFLAKRFQYKVHDPIYPDDDSEDMDGEMEIVARYRGV